MIGVFDSGYGGLTILRALTAELPQYSYMYFGDNARAPYGERHPDEIFEFTTQGVEYLFSQGCELVILGCNTASACALRRIQREVLPERYPAKRVLGIVVPTIEQVTGASWRHTTPITTPISSEVYTVGVLGTTATVTSGAYEDEIHKRNQSIRVVQQACPTLAAAIEQGADKKVLDNLIQDCLNGLIAKADGALSAVLLGCTHYALIAEDIKAHLPVEVALYEQPAIVAKSLKEYLKNHPEIESNLDHTGGLRFITTGAHLLTSQAASRFFGATVKFDPQADE